MLMSSIRRSMQSSSRVEHDIKNLKFFIQLENKNEAILEYKKLPERVIELYHTEVPSEYRGKGLAENLVKNALRHCIENNYKVYPSCTYVGRYVRDLASEEEKKIVVKQPQQPYINPNADN